MENLIKITIEPSGPSGIMLTAEYSSGRIIRSIHIVKNSVSASLEIKHLREGTLAILDKMIDEI